MTHAKITFTVCRRQTEGLCEWVSKENRSVVALLCRYCRFKDMRWHHCDEFFNVSGWGMVKR